MIENTILLANDIARIGKPDKVKAYEPYFKSAYQLHPSFEGLVLQNSSTEMFDWHAKQSAVSAWQQKISVNPHDFGYLKQYSSTEIPITQALQVGLTAAQQTFICIKL